MSAMFRIGIWREWREQRRTVFASFALVGGLVALAASFAEETLVGSAALSQVGAAATALVVAIAVGTELFSRDLHPARRLVERTPGGSRAVVMPKLVFFAAVLACGAVFGFAAGAAASAARLGTAGLRTALDDLPGTLGMIGAVVFVAAWIPAVSTWGPRGFLAFPATAVLLALLGVPLVAALGPNRAAVLSWLRPGLLTVCVLLVVPLVGAVAAAALSLAGRRFDRGGWTAFARGGVVAIASFAPLWCHGAWSARVWATCDPTAADFRIERALLDPTGRTLLLATRHGQARARRPVHTLRVDVASGSWTRAGAAGDAFLDRVDRIDGVRVWPTGFGRSPVASMTPAGGASHRFVAVEEGTELDPARARESAARHLAQASPLRMPDGRAVWIAGDRLHHGGPEGTRYTVPWPAAAVPFSAVGYGVRYFDRAANAFAVFDLTRSRVLDAIVMDAARSHHVDLRVLADGRILARLRHPSPAVWVEVDPDSGAESAVRGLESDDDVGPVLADGRFLAVSHGTSSFARRARREPLLLVDPATGGRLAVTTADGSPALVASVDDALGDRRWPASLPGGRRVVRIAPDRFAVLDLARARLAEPFDAYGIIAIEAETVLVVDVSRRRVERIAIDSGRREVVFRGDRGARPR